MSEAPLISIIIPTIERNTLDRAIDSALSQTVSGGTIEVVVVNDSGSELSLPDRLLNDSRLSLVTTMRSKQSFSRNTGAAVARGSYLLFLDDDDYLAPGALAALLEIIADQPCFVAAYGGSTFVDAGDNELGKLNLGVTGNCASHMLAGAWIQFGSACIRSEAFFNVGGMSPMIKSAVDIDFFRRLSMIGDFCNTPAQIVNILRGGGWRTSINFSFDDVRKSREYILDQNNAFHRLVQSAQQPYWRGRVFKAYVASIAWNMRQGRLMKAISRILYAGRSLLAAGSGLFSSEFRQALRDRHVPATPHQVLYGSE